MPQEEGLTDSRDHAQAGGGVRELNLGGRSVAGERGIDLRDLGFVGAVSEEARSEIRANERRAARVLSTAHLYWFGGR